MLFEHGVDIYEAVPGAELLTPEHMRHNLPPELFQTLVCCCCKRMDIGMLSSAVQRQKIDRGCLGGFVE